MRKAILMVALFAFGVFISGCDKSEQNKDDLSKKFEAAEKNAPKTGEGVAGQ